jgi:hypothetical protein
MSNEGRLTITVNCESTAGEVELEVSCNVISEGSNEDWDCYGEDWEVRDPEGQLLDWDLAMVLMDRNEGDLNCLVGEAFLGSLGCPHEFKDRKFPYNQHDPRGRLVMVHGYGRIMGEIALGVITSWRVSPIIGEEGDCWMVWPLEEWLAMEHERCEVDPDVSENWICVDRPKPEEGKLHPAWPCNALCQGKAMGRCKPTPEALEKAKQEAKT